MGLRLCTEMPNDSIGIEDLVNKPLRKNMPMANVISYDSATRDQFDIKTQTVLDSIQRQFPIVEIELPLDDESQQWFVQVYRDGNDMPEGFFGETTYEAALRVANALKIET